jgi:hypothetical protein
MRLLALPPLLLVACAVAAQDKPKPKLPLGKETTVVTGPLDKEGYVDYPAALNERLGKGITPAANANVLLVRALGPAPEGGSGLPDAYFRWLGIDRPPANGDYLVGLDRYLRDTLKLEPDAVPAIYDQQSRATQRPWSELAYPQIAGWVKRNEKPLAVVAEAVKRPEYFNPLLPPRPDGGPGGVLGALLPTTQKCREVAAALTARAMLRLAEKKYDAAWADLMTAHRLGRLVSRGATIIESLVGIAIHQVASTATLAYLERADPTADQVRARLKELQSLPPLAPLADKIDLGERFMYLDCVQMIRRGGISELEGLAKGQPGKLTPEQLAALEKIDWATPLKNGNAWYDRIVAAARLTDRAAREKAFGGIEADVRKLKAELGKAPGLARLFRDPADKAVGKTIGDILIGLLLPALQRLQEAYDRADQVERNLHVAFALAAYKKDTGRYPAKLDDLAPKYLAAVPGDLFSGKSLVYRPDDRGYLLYSVGMNGKDDGGRWTDDDPPGDDPRVRMPLPPLRKE